MGRKTPYCRKYRVNMEIVMNSILSHAEGDAMRQRARIQSNNTTDEVTVSDQNCLTTSIIRNFCHPNLIIKIYQNRTKSYTNLPIMTTP